MVVVRCVKKVMSTNGFTNMKMGIGAAGNQIGAGIAGGANAVNNQLESARSKKFRNQRRAFLACADNDDDRWLIYLRRAREGDPEALAYLETLDEAEREWNPQWEPTPLAEQEEWFRFAKKQRCS